MSISYTLWLHYKQGDDLAAYLEDAKGDNSLALQNWSDSFKENAAITYRLADVVKNHAIKIYADVHHIEFVPLDKKAEGLLEVLAAEKLLDREELDDEEDFEDELFDEEPLEDTK